MNSTLNTPGTKNPGKRLVHRFQRDLNAGLSVAVIAIPQAIAYALIAQVPPQYGIYTLVIQVGLGVLLNHNPRMAIGPTNTQSLLVASVLIHLSALEGAERGERLVQLAVTLTLLKGVIQLLLAGLRLGVLARYFSRSVILGFTAGAGTLIAIGQLPSFLGIEDPQNYNSLPATVTTLLHSANSLRGVSWQAVLVAVLSILIVVACRRRSRLLPGALFALLVTGALSVWLGWNVSSTDPTLPPVVPCVTWNPVPLKEIPWPSYDLPTIYSLVGGAFALSVLGMVETYSISRSITSTADTTSRPDREMAAQGVIHIISSFFGCIPGSGSFARSAMNVHAGAATRYAGLVCVVLVGGAFWLASPWINYLPKATLAGQLMVMAFALLNWRGIRQIIRSDMVDGSVLIFTFLATLLLPLHYAIFAGVLLNLALYIRNISRLNILELVPQSETGFSERPMQSPDDFVPREIVILQLHGDLFFGLADDLAQYLERVCRSPVEILVIRLKATRSIDTTVMHRIAAFARDFTGRGGQLLCCGISPALRDKMQRFGLIDQLGKENLFESSDTVYDGARAALAYAKQLRGKTG